MKRPADLVSAGLSFKELLKKPLSYRLFTGCSEKYLGRIRKSDLITGDAPFLRKHVFRKIRALGVKTIVNYRRVSTGFFTFIFHHSAKSAHCIPRNTHLVQSRSEKCLFHGARNICGAHDRVQPVSHRTGNCSRTIFQGFRPRSPLAASQDAVCNRN